MPKTHCHTANGRRSPTYNSWVSMMRRCYDRSNNRFYCYGAVGVTVCERWHTFENFLADMGERLDGTTLGRHHDQGNYEPGNVSWETSSQQAERQLGEKNWQARLTEENVLAARALYEPFTKRGFSLKNMAADLGVAMPTLSQAVKGITWAHVT